jgi:hypothetical protein
MFKYDTLEIATATIPAVFRTFVTSLMLLDIKSKLREILHESDEFKWNATTWAEKMSWQSI